MDNVYKLFALIMENLGQVAGKIDELYSLQRNINTLGGQLSDFQRDMGAALSSINTELTTIENRLDVLEGGEEPPAEPPIEP
jgi:prefoldin subunit 5